jgi:hypothetical protein
VAVAFGALIGSLPGLIDRITPTPYPYWLIDGALISSTITNIIFLTYF